MTIGENFLSFSRLRLECWDQYLDYSYSPVLKIGDNVAMNYNCHIGCINHIEIGNNVLFASNVYITDHFHGFIDERDKSCIPAERELYSKGAVIIRDNVWIGENVTILPGVEVGKNCIIGANSVVTKSFPDNSVLAGIPARMIKTI